jgi:CBS domain-containing protein
VNVGRIMTTDVVAVRPETPYKETVERLVGSDVSGLPVVDDDGRLLGIVTESDLVAKEAYGGRRPRALALLADLLSARDHHWVTKAAGWTAADVMTKRVTICLPSEDVRLVARRMLERGVKRMPVVDDRGALVGIISRQDLLRGLTRPDEEIATEVARLLRTDPNRPDDHRVTSSVEDGRVTLTGDVRYAWDEPIIVEMIRGVDGVIDVDSHLHHREPNPSLPKPPWMLGTR